MIIRKGFAGKKRLFAEFGEGDILFTGSASVDGKVLIAFSNSNKKHSLDEYIDTIGETWENINPEIVFSFTNPKSIQNIIDSLSECKERLEADLDDR